jgi:hypothetical protein
LYRKFGIPKLGFADIVIGDSTAASLLSLHPATRLENMYIAPLHIAGMLIGLAGG